MIGCIFSFGIAANALAADITVPLTRAGWVDLKFDKLPANQVTIENGRIQVQVKNSAGPIIYALPAPTKVSGISISGIYKGDKKVETTAFDEDSVLRLGLVASGSKRLTGPKKWLAAAWVKKLFSLAPEGSGLDKIFFYNLTNRPALMGQGRIHPKSELMSESVVSVVEKNGEFKFKKQLAEPLSVVAVWLSIDGDDSQSEFSTTINSLVLH